MNHNEGQDGPDDFDRPQTVASYSAALSVIAGGVEFAITAISQIFEAIDVKYDGDDDAPDRWTDIQRERDVVRRIVTAVVEAKGGDQLGFAPELLTFIKS